MDNFAYSARSVYGNSFQASSLDQTIPEENDQRALDIEANNQPKAQANKGSMFTWLGVLVLFVVLFQFGAVKVSS